MTPDILIVSPGDCQRLTEALSKPLSEPLPAERAPDGVEADFNPALTDAVLEEIEAQINDPWVTAVISELRHMRKLYCDDFAQFMIDDDDPEEWERWVFRSGKPSWFRLPEWFLRKYEWLRPKEEE